VHAAERLEDPLHLGHVERGRYPLPGDIAERDDNVSFIGRLAAYRYYNMDQVAAMALAEADKLVARYRPGP